MKFTYKIKMVDGSRYEFVRDATLNWGGATNPYLLIEFDDHNLLLVKTNIVSVSVSKKEEKKGE